MANIKIKPAGIQMPKVDQRSLEDIAYLLDLSEIIDQGDLIAGNIEGSTSLAEVEVYGIRAKSVNSLEAKIKYVGIIDAPYLDANITILFDVMSGSRKAAVFTVRIHR